MRRIYEYTDYRRYLSDYMEECRKKSPSYSYRLFALKAGFRARTYLHKVVTGLQPLTRASAYKVAMAMDLNTDETQYFESLVLMAHAKSPEEKSHYSARLRSLLRKRDSVKLNADKLSYFLNWHHAVVRELVTIFDFQEDYRKLGSRVVPPISADKARRSVKLLVRLGLIRRLANGIYEQTDKFLVAGDDKTKEAVRGFQRDMMGLAQQSIAQFPVTERNISSLTIGLSKKSFERIHREIADFRDYVKGIVDRDDPAECVYQINFQMFPVSRTTTAKDRTK